MAWSLRRELEQPADSCVSSPRRVQRVAPWVMAPQRMERKAWRQAQRAGLESRQAQLRLAELALW